MNGVKVFIRHFAMSSRRPSPPYWREAATVIVAAPHSSNINENAPHTSLDQGPYEILMLKRGVSSPFAPNNFVYPGGCITNEDFDRPAWSRIFDNISGYSMKNIESHFHISGPKADMMKAKYSWDEYLIPEVAFRICALRETFEESGLLLVTHQDAFQKPTPNYVGGRFVPDMHEMPEHFNVSEWRKRIIQNPSTFVELCSKYQVVPNIWSLFEWSNWLTPAMKAIEAPPDKPKRYDTMFYVCCLERFPEGVEACSEEMTDAVWRTPQQWLSEHRSKNIKMIGPQVYESDRMTALPCINSLKKYTRKREQLGMVRFLPMIAVCEDDIALLLPGDELYPESYNPEQFHPLNVQMKLKDLMTYKNGGRYHRADRSERGYICSIQLPCGLLANPSATVQEHKTNADPEIVLQRALRGKL